MQLILPPTKTKPEHGEEPKPVSPLKHLYRCIEKICFKVGENRYQAESVCDVVRCIVECEDCTLMAEVLADIKNVDAARKVRQRVRELTTRFPLPY